MRPTPNSDPLRLSITVLATVACVRNALGPGHGKRYHHTGSVVILIVLIDVAGQLILAWLVDGPLQRSRLARHNIFDFRFLAVGLEWLVVVAGKFQDPFMLLLASVIKDKLHRPGWDAGLVHLKLEFAHLDMDFGGAASSLAAATGRQG